jgi:hypothetical protein
LHCITQKGLALFRPAAALKVSNIATEGMRSVTGLWCKNFPLSEYMLSAAENENNDKSSFL